MLITNLVGGLLFAAAVVYTHAFQPEVHRAFSDIGRESLQGSFGDILVKGVFAGWLIALMVWLLPHAETAKVWVIILLTYAVGLGGFAHVVRSDQGAAGARRVVPTRITAAYAAIYLAPYRMRWVVDQRFAG